MNPMMNSRQSSILLTIAMVLAAIGRSLAQDTDEPRGRFADEVRAMRGRAMYIRQEFASMSGAIIGLDGFIKDDLVDAKQAFDTFIGLVEQSARAWQNENETEAKRLRGEADKAERICDVWRTRLWDYRRRQAEIAPTEQWFSAFTRWTAKEAMAELNAWVIARQAAADAWGTLAEATVPDADPHRIDELKEQAFAADARAEIAEWQAAWSRSREEILYDKTLSSAELTARINALQNACAQRIKLRQEQIQFDRQRRRLDANVQNALADLRKAYDSARQARENAASTR